MTAAELDLTTPEAYEVMEYYKQLLVQNDVRSPFADHQVIKYETDVTSLHVDSIHDEIEAEIKARIERIRNGGETQIVILTGEPGSGKSHLINCLRASADEDQSGYRIICNSNHWKVGEFNGCLLDWLVDALCIPIKSSQPLPLPQASSNGVHTHLDYDHLLLNKVRALAYAALKQILDKPGFIRQFELVARRRLSWSWNFVKFVGNSILRAGTLAYAALKQMRNIREFFQEFKSVVRKCLLWRPWQVLSQPQSSELEEMVEHQDDEVFRRLKFDQFASFFCESFLDESTNQFHVALVHVLLRHLFKEDRTNVISWLKGAGNLDESFLKKAGVVEAVDRDDKKIEVVKVLISLFTRQVSQHLESDSPESPGDLVFVLAFDQIEGRDRLFESDNDWLTFFAQLSELYNTLPNVFIMFTMTTMDRENLYPKMEQQFKDRIRRDERFFLRNVEPQAALALFEQRLRRCLKDAYENVFQRLDTASQPCLPFTKEEVEGLAKKNTLRETLRKLDKEFCDRIGNLTIGPRHDYLFERRRIENEFADVDTFKALEDHLQDLRTLLWHSQFQEILERTWHLQIMDVDDEESFPKTLKVPKNFRGIRVRAKASSQADADRLCVYLVMLPYSYKKGTETVVSQFVGKKGKLRPGVEVWFLRPGVIDRTRLIPDEIKTVPDLSSATGAVVQALNNTLNRQYESELSLNEGG